MRKMLRAAFRAFWHFCLSPLKKARHSALLSIKPAAPACFSLMQLCGAVRVVTNMTTRRSRKSEDAKSEAVAVQALVEAHQRLIAEKDRTLGEKDAHIADDEARIAKLEAEVEKHQKAWWRNDTRNSIVSFLVGAFLTRFVAAAVHIYLTRTSTFFALFFVSIYVFTAAYFTYRTIKSAYLGWKAASKTGHVERYAVQCVYSLILAFAILASFSTPRRAHHDASFAFYWIFPISLISAVCSYVLMGVQARKEGRDPPKFTQMLAMASPK